MGSITGCVSVSWCFSAAMYLLKISLLIEKIFFFLFTAVYPNKELNIFKFLYKGVDQAIFCCSTLSNTSDQSAV